MAATYDLFLSYRWLDREAIEPLLGALRSMGITVWQDVREVADLASIQQAVNAGLAKSRALLAWYSRSYNESRACQWELTCAYLAGEAEGDPRRRVFVVNPETSNGHIHLPALFDQLHLSGAGWPGDPAAVSSLAQGILAALKVRGHIDPIGSALCAGIPSWWPHHRTGSMRFVGRLRELWQVHGALQAGEAAMLTGSAGRPGVVQVRGLGGSGKSLLAEEYALRFGAAYPGGVFWLRAFDYVDNDHIAEPAEYTARLEIQLRDLLASLGLHPHGSHPSEVRGTLKRHFDRIGKPFLWIVDDLPAELGDAGLSPWLAPHAVGRTLVTTRSRRLNHIHAIDLPQLDRDDALRLLTRGRPVEASIEPFARDLCAELGDHALAVDVASALVQRRGYAASLSSLRRSDRDNLEFAATGFSEALPNGHQRSIATTLIASIREMNEPASDILCLAAVVAAAPIPRDLIWRSIARADLLDEDAANDWCDLAIDQLLASSLAESIDEVAISIHTLVSRTQRTRKSHLLRAPKLRPAIVKTLNEALLQAQEVREHGDLAAWMPHARELARHPEDADEATLTGLVAFHDLEQGRYALAAQGFQAQFEHRRRALGEEDRDTLISIAGLGVAEEHLGNASRAQMLHEQVLGVRRRLLGEEHPETLKSMANVAVVLEKKGELARARELNQQVLDARRRTLGDEHSDTLDSMNNLAVVLGQQGDRARERELHERVLEIQRQTLGEQHPKTVKSMVNLAGTLLHSGDLTSARALMELALSFGEALGGDDHPDTLAAKNTLAVIMWLQGEWRSARQLQELLLEKYRYLLGEDHPMTLNFIGNLGGFMREQGDLDEARALHERAAEISGRIRGQEHPDSLRLSGQLARTVREQGDLKRARSIEERVLEAKRRTLGEEHQATLGTMSSLATTLFRLGDFDSARELVARSLVLSKSVLGDEHPDTLVAMKTLAGVLWRMGDLHGARTLQEAVLKVYRQTRSADHPEILSLMSNLALTMRDQGDLPGARALNEQVLKARQRLLGEEHPDTFRSIGNLALVVWMQGEQGLGTELLAAAASGLKRTLGELHPDAIDATNVLRKISTSG